MAEKKGKSFWAGVASRAKAGNPFSARMLYYKKQRDKGK
jgi:hypothetical protein